MNKIHQIKLSEIDSKKYPEQFTSCVVLSHEKKLILQKRGDNWPSYPGYISLFGGKIEKYETPTSAIIRELNEELGGIINPCELTYLGAITEQVSGHKELIHEFFWQDINATITGCYEGDILSFNNFAQVLNQSKLIDDVEWAINQCVKKRLVT